MLFSHYSITLEINLLASLVEDANKGNHNDIKWREEVDFLSLPKQVICGFLTQPTKVKPLHNYPQPSTNQYP